MKFVQGFGQHIKTLMSLLTLSLFSSRCFAVGDILAEQSAETLSIVAIAVVSIILVFIIVMLVMRASVKKHRNLYQQRSQQLTETQSLIDTANYGIIHLDKNGQILYTNRAAGLMLGKKPQQLQQQAFSEVVDLQPLEKLTHAINTFGHGIQQSYVEAGKRHVLFNVNPDKNDNTDTAMIITLMDVSDFQRRSDEQQAKISLQQQLLEQNKLGQVFINIADKQVEVNSVFAQMLQQSVDETNGPLEQLHKSVCSEDWQIWQNALEQGKQGQPFELRCRFATQAGDVLTQIYGFVSQQDEDGKAQALHLTVQPCQEIHSLQQQNGAQQHIMRGLLSANPNAMYYLDQQGNLADCNGSFEMLFGTNLLSIQGQNINQLDFIPDAIRQMHTVDELMLASMGGGMYKEIELKVNDSETKLLRVRLQSYKNAEGKSAGLIGIFEDVTVQKHIEQQLQQTEQRFTDMLDLAPMAVAVIDKDDHIIQANHALTDRLGLTAKEMKKGSFYELFTDPKQSGKAAKLLHQTGRVREFAAILQGNSKDLCPSELHIDVFDKEQQTYLCWIADISNQQFHQDKFESLLQHSSMPMAVFTDEGFNQLNPAACEFFDIEDEDDLFGLFPYSEQLNGNADAQETLQQKIKQVKRDGKALSLVWQHKHKEQFLPCQATYVPMYKGKELDSILCVWMDMRAINQAAEERMQAVNLQQAAERTAAEKQQLLESSQDQLANKVKSLSETENRLQEAQQDLSQKQSKISDLQQAHQNVTDNLQQLQQDYAKSRSLLEDSQQSNAELEEQLQQSSVKVGALEKQRSQIADALQNSEQQYQRSQEQLAESEETSERLQQEQLQQQQELSEFVAQIDSLKQSIQQKDQQILQVSDHIEGLQAQLLSSGQAGEKLREQLVNQRKASEKAELQRRELELACNKAQSELSGKAQHIEHLQLEMDKFEQMSNQQKGDMEQQQKLLQQELEAKQQQLQETTKTLDETKRQAEADKQVKFEQQQRLQQLKDELQDVEKRTNEEQQRIAQSSQQWQEQQQALQQELEAKQQQLQETQQILNESKQQTEEEKAEKARQTEKFEQLKNELAEVERRTAQKQQEMSQSDQQRQQQQQALQQELEAKQQQLLQTQQKLDETQRQSDADRAEREQQQQKLELLKVELSGVEQRSQIQQEMMQGSDEQWRQNHEEIEAQKKQLQQALIEAENQNAAMQQQLQGSLVELQKAENQVSETQTGEQKLQQELELARKQAEELQELLLQREQQESKLQNQLNEQQKTLLESESNISALEGQQKQLTEQLHAVQQEYSHTKQDLSTQDSNQSELAEQLKRLESELKDNQQQLDSKEQALQDAQKQLQTSQQQIEQQEKALVDAHKEELQQAKIAAEKAPPAEKKPIPDFATLDMPQDPEVWFALLPYLQNNPSSAPLPVELNALMDELEQATQITDEAVQAEDAGKILVNSRKLVKIATKIASEPLTDLSTQLEAAVKQGQVDSISIFWPNMKKSLLITLRVIYSHLQG
ncbi:PAS domain S-box protein [Alteromonadaceae bacterium BrNp21-10]|nr:PAS domain S-box protein [Alteromonadaceae bacterium BrNp21-10]